MSYSSLLSSNPKKIVVLRALMLGDLLCSIPAFRALRKALPDSHITLIGLPWAKSFTERFSAYFDDFIEFPGYPGLPEREVDVSYFPQFLHDVQSRHFDLAIQMHGSGPFVNSLIELFGAASMAGFYKEHDYRPLGDFMPFPEDEHEISIFLRLMKFIGVEPDGGELEFPLFEHDKKELQELDGINELFNSDYICIHPGARLLTRRWCVERFAYTANALAQAGFKIVITGNKDELLLVEEMTKYLDCPYVNLAGKTSVGAFAALLKKAKLLISNDTGVSHIASALKTPSVIIVTGSDPRRWAPLNQSLHKPVFFNMSCRPCAFERCPYGMPCAQQVEVEQVVLQAKALLQQTNSLAVSV